MPCIAPGEVYALVWLEAALAPPPYEWVPETDAELLYPTEAGLLMLSSRMDEPPSTVLDMDMPFCASRALSCRFSSASRSLSWLMLE